MRKNAQGSVEYLFVITIAIILIMLFVGKFFGPRFGTIHKAGEFQDSIEENISTRMESIIEKNR